jgi:hypothetical protein
MLLGFKERFVMPIQIGTKVFTLRNKRKVQPKIGETLYMYSGLRTSKCKLISNKEKLVSIQEVHVFIRQVMEQITIRISVDKRMLTEAEIVQFVKFDGFADRVDFANYWFKESKIKNTMGKECSAKMEMYHWTDLKY